jgi:hypothetical protein
MTRNHRQEALCRAYVQAIAAQAGMLCSRPEPDYGIDLSLRSVRQRGSRRQDTRVQLDLQLRSTTQATVAENHLSYDLDARTYNYLREPSDIRCLLVLLVLPDDEARWLEQSLEQLILRDCAYWQSLRDAGPTTATSSVRITVPRSQVFSVQALQSMLGRPA